MVRALSFVFLSVFWVACGSSSPAGDIQQGTDQVTVPDTSAVDANVDGGGQDSVQDNGVDVTQDVAPPDDTTQPPDLSPDVADTAADQSAPDMADVPPPPDEDEDGVPDDEDNCPEGFNPLQEDCDSNGTGDLC